MDAKETVQAISSAFEDVEFPRHLGLRAAMSVDGSWESDKQILEDITKNRDLHVERWQDLPLDELKECSIALSYLDSQGLQFYVPAYLVAAITHNDRALASDLAFLFTPPEPAEAKELQRYYYERMAWVTGVKKEACISAMRHMVSVFDDDILSLRQDYKRLLDMDFWQPD